MHYYTMGAEVWRSADEWPPPGTEELRLHLADDGRLSKVSGTTSGRDEWPVDPSLGSGPMTRWTALVGGTESAILYPNWARFGERALTYTSPPLPEALEVTGHPMVTLFLSADGADASVFVVLEDVAPNGEASYVTEGSLRALHRNSIASSPPYRDAVPVRLYDRAGSAPLQPGEVAELHFDLLPTSYEFPVGHRLRLSIAAVDADYFDPIEGITSLTIHWGEEHPSGLSLPIALRR